MELGILAVKNEEANPGALYWSQEKICNEFSDLCEKIGASDEVMQIAKSMCREAFELGLKRPRSTHSFIAASLFMALRKNEENMPLREFLTKIDANSRQRQEIAFYYRTLFVELNLNLPVVNPSSLVQEIAGKMHSSRETIDLSVRLLQVTKHSRPEITGRSPIAIAGAAMYMASRQIGEQITQKEIAEAAGVTEACVRNSVKAFDYHKDYRWKLPRMPYKIPR